MKITEFSLEQLNVYFKPDMLLRLNKGDVVRAKVVEISAHKISLKLPDGNIITAALMSPASAKKGEQVELIVKDISGDKIFLETIKTDGEKSVQLENEIKNLLMDIGVKPDKKSMEIASPHLSNGYIYYFTIKDNILTYYQYISPNDNTFEAKGSINLDAIQFSYTVTYKVDGIRPNMKKGLERRYARYARMK